MHEKNVHSRRDSDNVNSDPNAENGIAYMHTCTMDSVQVFLKKIITGEHVFLMGTASVNRDDLSSIFLE